MNLAALRIITDDVDRLVAFYERVAGIAARRLAPVFAEITTDTGTLAIAATATAPGWTTPAANRSVVVDLRVADVDAEYARLRPLIGEPVQEPTLMPWGNRSLLFRDPDGTLVNLFTPVTPEALARQRS
ncbi:VOC family protein [Nocardia sp. NPDC050697]|uniref:VOC family protein n=1 Tax=Nocardia sp. NPDC050697 TaxID=3155158 RepID=UPI0033C5BEC5